MAVRLEAVDPDQRTGDFCQCHRWEPLLRTAPSREAEHSPWRNMTPAEWDQASAAYRASREAGLTGLQKQRLAAAALQPDAPAPDLLAAVEALCEALDQWLADQQRGEFPHSEQQRVHDALLRAPASREAEE